VNAEVPNQKVFVVKDGLQLRGDPRDIAIPADQYKEVVKWCKKMKVKAEIPLSRDNKNIAEYYFGMHLWRVQDEKQRVWFAMKWA
jgi:hypothetical protein